MNEVVILKQGDTSPVPQRPASTADALLALIERASRDPSVDLDKMERLLQMREAAESKAQEKAFQVAMSAAQKAMRPIAADADNNQTKSRYASYAQLDRALKPIYTDHGFSLTFDTAADDRPDYIGIVCDVMHDDGHKRRYSIPMPADGKGAKGGDVMTKTHATGSAVSYGMRYLLKMIFNVAVGEFDDDGNAASGYETHSGKINAQQVAQLESLIKEIGGDKAGNLTAVTLSHFSLQARQNIATVAEIPADMFDIVHRAIEKKRKK